ncbi:MAG: Kelch repeat-containing protein [Phycisphaerae bacterium]
MTVAAWTRSQLALADSRGNNIAMDRILLPGAFLFALLPATAFAHFAYIVPSEDNQSAVVIMAETLDPQDGISVEYLGSLELWMKGVDGKPSRMPLRKKDERSLQVDLPGNGDRVVFGFADLGVMKRGSKPHRLYYYPKSIVGQALGQYSHRGDGAPVELVPVKGTGDNGHRLLYLVDGQPKSGAEITVVFPDGRNEVLSTNDQGMTPPMMDDGRYAAWARNWLDVPGTHEGEAYEQLRQYATLVFDAASSTPSSSSISNDAITVSSWSPMPEAAASFGAVEADGWLYVYGGHTAPTHVYHTRSSSGSFWRIDLARGGDWQALPGGTRVQGMNLAAIDGLIYRAGGMASLNEQGTPSKNESLRECQVFDPASMLWRDLPPMPAGRSSHDLVAVGTKLYVLGGWDMGEGRSPQWHREMFVMDVAEKEPTWRRASQPFYRRALMATTLDGKIYVAGGFNETNKPSLRVEIYDTRSDRWYEGPDIPGRPFAGFAPAMCTHDRRVMLSVGNGTLYRLSDDERKWEEVTKTSPRIVHRMASFGSHLLIMGGAHEEDMLNLVESVVLPPQWSGETDRAVATATSQTKSSTTPRDAKPVDDRSPVAWGQRTCPIMVSEFIDGESPVVTYDGRQIALCCETCISRWEQNPDGYAAVADIPQLRDVERPKRDIVQTFCPVFRDRVVTSKNPSTTYQGKKIYFFNSSARRRWENEPEKYLDLAILPQLAERPDAVKTTTATH